MQFFLLPVPALDDDDAVLFLLAIAARVLPMIIPPILDVDVASAGDFAPFFSLWRLAALLLLVFFAPLCYWMDYRDEHDVDTAKQRRRLLFAFLLANSVIF